MTYTRFSPRRPIKSFQDLEVYQKLLAVSVAVAKRITPVVIASHEVAKQSSNAQEQIDAVATLPRNDIQEKLVEIALELPVKIARAHSWRFSNKTRAIEILEDVMLGTNILIVYLEQYRDIENSNIEVEFFDEQIRSLSTTRFKVMHLQMSWKKFGGKDNV